MNERIELFGLNTCKSNSSILFSFGSSRRTDWGAGAGLVVLIAYTYILSIRKVIRRRSTSTATTSNTTIDVNNISVSVICAMWLRMYVQLGWNGFCVQLEERFSAHVCASDFNHLNWPVVIDHKTTIYTFAKQTSKNGNEMPIKRGTRHIFYSLLLRFFYASFAPVVKRIHFFGNLKI